MVVDDLVVCGAEPLFMTDYTVFGKVTPERVAEIVGGIAAGCVQAGCALIGGETAEHPGHFGPDDFDLAGAATGVVEADQLLGPDRVRPGDVVIAMASSGPALQRVLAGPQHHRGTGWTWPPCPPAWARPLGEELLIPTRIYARDCLALAAGAQVRAFAHVTGGGLAANLARVLPPHADAILDRGTWAARAGLRLAGPPAARRGQRRHGAGVQQGVGMAAIVAAADADRR